MPTGKGRAVALASSLLRWYARHRRRLPWRESPDPYRVLLSEVMLQQTTVETVIPYFERFVEAFPDLHELARARDDEVLRLWSGLGYYRRARNLLAAARAVEREHGGRIPRGADRLRRLPGVGRYTAAAVSAIAFGEPVVALDGNLIRVLARLSAQEEDPRTASGERALRVFGESLVREGDPSAINQALMDLGASLCSARRPRCLPCPLVDHCEARSRGIAERIPPPRARRAREEVSLAAGVVERRGRVLLRRRTGEIMPGLWEFPLAALAGRGSAEKILDTEFRSLCGLEVRDLEEVATIRHAITHRRIRIRILKGRAGRPAGPPGRLAEAPAAYQAILGGPRGAGEIRWVSPADLGDLPMTGMARKIARAVER